MWVPVGAGRRASEQLSALPSHYHPAGAHELQAAEESGLVAPHHPAATTLATVLVDFLGQDVSHTCNPPHVAVCGNATDRWLYTGALCLAVCDPLTNGLLRGEATGFPLLKRWICGAPLTRLPLMGSPPRRRPAPRLPMLQPGLCSESASWTLAGGS